MSGSDESSAPPRPGAVRRVIVEQVSRSFGATPALSKVSCEFAAGAITLLTGPNGAGKSTLLALVGTRLRPSRGHVRHESANGKTLARAEVRAELGWVSHETYCYEQLSGLQNLALYAELQGVTPGECEGVRERLGLGRFAERPLSTLSRGQRQRVALGRALLHGPSLLLLDEPWTGLDSASGALLERVVREEAERGAVVVIVSHSEGLRERLDAREVRLERGRLAAVA